MTIIATSNKFYVYLHLRKTDGKPFYVGKGCNRRAYDFSGRSQYWQRVRNKHGCIVKILFANLEESLSLELEKEIIATLRNDGYNLCNLTEGGEGTSGYVMPEERRLSLKEKNKHSLELARLALANMVITDEMRLNRSLCQLGKRHTEATKQKMSKTRYNSPPHKDDTIYTFYHKSGDIFVGTRIELCRTYELDPKQIRNLFATKPSKTQKGWSLQKFHNGDSK